MIPIAVPHEITAAAMAHGDTMITGKPQAVMVHVIVGTANAVGRIINASKARVPMFFTDCRVPRPIRRAWLVFALDPNGRFCIERIS